jgi:hypothetical protein
VPYSGLIPRSNIFSCSRELSVLFRCRHPVQFSFTQRLPDLVVPNSPIFFSLRLRARECLVDFGEKKTKLINFFLGVGRWHFVIYTLKTFNTCCGSWAPSQIPSFQRTANKGEKNTLFLENFQTGVCACVCAQRRKDGRLGFHSFRLKIEGSHHTW